MGVGPKGADECTLMRGHRNAFPCHCKERAGFYK